MAEPNTSAMDQLNAYVLAAGLTKSALNLNGLATRQRDNVMRVLTGLVERRQDDLAQVESLTTAHQSLSYDHERLAAMHRRAEIAMGNAQREQEAAKAQLKAMTERLKKEEAAHRASRDEANKARTALAFVRSQAQYETKKREAQVEKTMQNWQKISSEHARLLSANITTGLLCLNPVDGNQPGPRVDSFWDPSIKALDQIREGLQEENEAFRHVTLSAANKLQRVLALVNGEEPPSPMDPSTFFNQLDTTSTQVSSSTTHPNAADAKLKGMIGKLQTRIEVQIAAKANSVQRDESAINDEMTQVKTMLEGKVQHLEAELAVGREMAEEHLRLLAEFSKPSEGASSSVTSDGASHVDDGRVQRDSLLAERLQLTDRAVKLGQERAAFEAERRVFAEERRAKQLQELLAELPVSPPSTATNAQAIAPSVEFAEVVEEIADAKIGKTDSRSRPSMPSATRPVVPSPLAMSAQRTPPRDRSPRAVSAARRRSVRRAPTTPLARLVLQKVTIEKASERKAQKVLAKLQAAQDPDTVRPDQEGLGAVGSNANRGRSTAVVAVPISKAAPTSTTKVKSISPSRRKALMDSQKAARATRDSSLTSSQTLRTSLLEKATGLGPRSAAAPKNNVWR